MHRNITLAAAAFLSLGIFVGCGPQKTASASGSKGGKTASTATTGTNAAEPGTPLQPEGSPGGTAPKPGVAPPVKPGETANPKPSTPGGTAPKPVPNVQYYSLQLKFKKGQSLAYKVVNKQTVSIKMGDKGQSTSNTTEMKHTYTVQKVENGRSTVQLKGSDFKVNIDGAAAGQAANAKKMMEQLAKDAVTIEIDENGQMQATGAAAMTLLLSSSESGLGFMGLNYAGGPVPMGHTWSGELDMAKMPSMGAQWQNAKIPIKYTLKSVDKAKGTATIDFTMTGSPSMSYETPAAQQPEGDSGQPKMEKRTIKMKMNSTGSIVVRISDGMPILVKRTQTFASEAPANQGGSQSQKMEMTISLIQ